MIDFKEGAVCYADGKQWFGDDNLYYSRESLKVVTKSYLLEQRDFQLNEPREGYYIPKSELDTEEKYNKAVEVFGLSGFKLFSDTRGFKGLQDYIVNGFGVHNRQIHNLSSSDACKVKLTFDQLMAIGELKRKMNERENEFIESRELDIEVIKKSTGSGGCGGDSAFGFLNTSESPNSSKPKSKEAYRILESMGIELDNVEGKWFKKEWL